jgi:hypothetical protein
VVLGIQHAGLHVVLAEAGVDPPCFRNRNPFSLRRASAA